MCNNATKIKSSTHCKRRKDVGCVAFCRIWSENVFSQQLVHYIACRKLSSVTSYNTRFTNYTCVNLRSLVVKKKIVKLHAIERSPIHKRWRFQKKKKTMRRSERIGAGSLTTCVKMCIFYFTYIKMGPKNFRARVYIYIHIYIFIKSFIHPTSISLRQRMIAPLSSYCFDKFFIFVRRSVRTRKLI